MVWKFGAAVDQLLADETVPAKIKAELERKRANPLTLSFAAKRLIAESAADYKHEKDASDYIDLLWAGHSKDFNKIVCAPDQIDRVGKVFDALKPATQKEYNKRFKRFAVRSELLAILPEYEGNIDDQRRKLLDLIARDRQLVSLIFSKREDLRKAFIQLLVDSLPFQFNRMIDFIVSHRELAADFTVVIKHITDGLPSSTPILDNFLRERLENDDKVRYAIRKNPTYFTETNFYIKLVKINKAGPEISRTFDSSGWTYIGWRIINALKRILPNRWLIYFNQEPYIRPYERSAYQGIKIASPAIKRVVRGTYNHAHLATPKASRSLEHSQLVADLKTVKRVVENEYPENTSLQHSLANAVIAAKQHNPNDHSLKNSLMDALQIVTAKPHDATLEHSPFGSPKRDATLEHSAQGLSGKRDATLEHSVQGLSGRNDATLEHSAQDLSGKRDATLEHSPSGSPAKRDTTLEHSPAGVPVQQDAKLINTLMYCALAAAQQHYAGNDELQHSMYAELAEVARHPLVDGELQHSVIEEAQVKRTPKRYDVTDINTFSPIPTTQRSTQRFFAGTYLMRDPNISFSTSDNENEDTHTVPRALDFGGIGSRQ